ncbi:hypothetical protein CTI12_AA222340 [Artemisia annua]|uniref:Phosphatidylinositol N-acetylglucosaminyltransferase subunit Y n=1 Tax=Artemisia annua TaxID=35608 RepID=A0A2U1NW56_ARTAN|nr:hypothetical protein CTI12_AA222340 [Artemisia annua]
MLNRSWNLDSIECCCLDIGIFLSGNRLLVFSSKNCRCTEDIPMISQLIRSNERAFWGVFFILFGSVFFGGFLYTAVISKLLPSSDNAIISAIQNDRYYCFLVPLTLPVIVVAVYFYWLSMKMFKHA